MLAITVEATLVSPDIVRITFFTMSGDAQATFEVPSCTKIAQIQHEARTMLNHSGRVSFVFQDGRCFRDLEDDLPVADVA